MRLVYFGTPDFAVPSLAKLIESPHEVCMVVSRPDKPVGRHREMMSPPVVELAQQHNIPCAQPKNLKGMGLAEALEETGAEAGVVVAFGRIIPSHLLELFRHGCVNLHPSMLPRHRGPSPIQWALVCGDSTTGVTTMQLDEGMDTGPLLLQERVAIEPKETAEMLSQRLAVIGAELLLQTLNELESGELAPRPQPDDGVNVTPMLRREFGEIDWSMPARQLTNRLRGFTPWPGLYTSFRNGRLKVHGLEEVMPAPPGDEEPGTVVAAQPAGLVVRCGRGSAVRITEMQRDGRSRLPADAFLIGERVSRGERLG